MRISDWSSDVFSSDLWGTSTRPEPVEGPLPQDHPLQRETPAGGLPAFVRCGLVPAYAVVGDCSSPRLLGEVVPANAPSLRNAASPPAPSAGSAFVQLSTWRCLMKSGASPIARAVLSHRACCCSGVIRRPRSPGGF